MKSRGSHDNKSVLSRVWILHVLSRLLRRGGVSDITGNVDLSIEMQQQ